ncbi:IclR family transcriptional regulator [Nocardia bhagyanarayanae]|uniref:IclR family transcriptional regulator n=2 Tax=Nocardia bhagyanarayanae TaxID=1215925 RepID=A0A543EVV9_9NOCA|nr:IclR family transcriptional regulator [Nocardia bhagyanarayanae]
MPSASSTHARTTSEQQMLPPSMIERVTLILDVFERPQTRRTLEQVAQRTRLPRSTAYRILEQLVRMNWLHRDENCYRLGRRSLGLGGRESAHGALRAAAAPVLHDLALRTGLVVHLAVLDGTDVYYLDKVGGRTVLDVPSRVGGRAPAHCTALGKSMLAWLEPEDIDAEYSGGLRRRTNRSIGDLDTLHRQLGFVRTANGLAFERGECVPGIGCAGYALRGPDGPVGAISTVCGTATPLNRVAPLLVGAARTITRELFGCPGALERWEDSGSNR